ncbi:MAG: hypothetical protein ACFFBV_02960, partial [Promethearchaeota archaeon]
VPCTNAKLRFYNQSDYDNETEIIANVSVDINGLATFISFSNTFGNWGNYTVDIFFGGFEQDFQVNPPSIPYRGYNFTLITQSYTRIEIIGTKRNLYNSTINLIDYPTSIYWNDYGSIYFNFTKQDILEPNAKTVTPDELTFQIFDKEELNPFSGKIDILSSEISPGIFNYTFNTTDFNLIGGTGYYFEIIGNYKSYVFNGTGYKSIIIQAVPTNIKYYDYSLTELTDKSFSVIYRETVNVTVDYINNNTGFSLIDALITYEWKYGSGTLNDDPLHADMYYFEFDSSPAPEDKDYIIYIRATLTNFSTIDDSIIVSILPRPTAINGATHYQISPDIYIYDSKYYFFEYNDTLLDITIGNLDVASYNWYRLDEDGNPLSGPGNEGSGVLLPAANNQYMLDFDTKSKEVGEYSIFITMQKNNYEVRNAFISLTINKRPISMDLYSNGVLRTRISIVQGSSINFSAVLTDKLNGSALIGANVTLQINGDNYILDPVLGSPGTYQYIFSTSHINTFFMPQTLTGQIIIELDNYEIDPEPITVVVNMPEIFGIPTFYFLMIVISVAAVVGSLIAYRTIQRARIPTFVKKTRQMKKNIKGEKTISDSVLYPIKEEYIVKKLGDKWEAIGLSLDDIMGVKKKKILPELKEEFKGGVD